MLVILSAPYAVCFVFCDYILLLVTLSPYLLLSDEESDAWNMNQHVIMLGAWCERAYTLYLPIWLFYEAEMLEICFLTKSKRNDWKLRLLETIEFRKKWSHHDLLSYSDHVKEINANKRLMQKDFIKYHSQEFWRTIEVIVGNVKKIPLLSRSCYKTLYFDFVPNNVNQKIFLSGCDVREMFVPSKLLWMLWTGMMQETGPGTKRWMDMILLPSW